MNEEELEWLLDIATPTGISYSGDQTITIDFANKVINYINKQKEVLNRLKVVYTSMQFSAPENMYIFIEQMGDLLEEIE